MAARNDSPSVAPPPPGGASSATILPVLDRAVMLASVEHDLILLRELVEIFLAESPGLLAQIRSGVSENRPERVERAAHTLKGALSAFGALRACEAARQLEQRGRDARLADAAQIIPALESDLIQVCHALSDFLRESGK